MAEPTDPVKAGDTMVGAWEQSGGATQPATLAGSPALVSSSERQGTQNPQKGGEDPEVVGCPLVIHPMATAMFRDGMAPSLQCLNRERRRVDAVFVLELEKEPIGSRRRDLDAETNRFG